MKTLHTVQLCRCGNLNIRVIWPKVIHLREGVRTRLSEKLPLCLVSWWPFMDAQGSILGVKELPVFHSWVCFNLLSLKRCQPPSMNDAL